jgi:hypothetical protein
MKSIGKKLIKRGYNYKWIKTEQKDVDSLLGIKIKE